MSDYIATLPTNYNYRLSEFIGEYSDMESHYKATFHTSILTMDSKYGNWNSKFQLFKICQLVYSPLFSLITVCVYSFQQASDKQNLENY